MKKNVAHSPDPEGKKDNTKKNKTGKLNHFSNNQAATLISNMTPLLKDCISHAEQLDTLLKPRTPRELIKIKRDLKELVTIKNHLTNLAEQSATP